MVRFAALNRSDPTAWLLDSEEPAAHLVTLTRLCGLSSDSRPVAQARRSLTADPGVRQLLDMLPDWEAPATVSGHDKPLLATNLLDLLGEIGVLAADDPRIDKLLDQMLAHTDEDGRFQMLGTGAGSPRPRWGTLLCDTHAISDVLLRFGRGDDPRVKRALETALSDLRETAQGLAWPCRPDPASGWRGPGRAGDCCPQTTLEALHAFSWLPSETRPPAIAAAARTVLGVWRSRATTKPYMFGHGLRFKQVKWPPTWYGAYEMVDTLGRLPEVWSDGAAPEDRQALAETAACLLAYNVALDGTVTPLSTFKGFEHHSFGQKKRPSPTATALVWAALARLDSLFDDIAAVRVETLTSSKGGTGRPLPPRIR
jgi:hypothetical protein